MDARTVTPSTAVDAAHHEPVTERARLVAFVQGHPNAPAGFAWWLRHAGDDEHAALVRRLAR
jgi:hypothetical protein